MIHIILSILCGVVSYLILRSLWTSAYSVAHDIAKAIAGHGKNHKDLLSDIIPALPGYSANTSWKSTVSKSTTTSVNTPVKASLETYRAALIENLSLRWPAIPRRTLTSIVDAQEDLLAIPVDVSKWGSIILQGIATDISEDFGLPPEIGRRLVMMTDIEDSTGLANARNRLESVAGVWLNSSEMPHEIFSTAAAILLVRGRPLGNIPRYIAALANTKHKPVHDPGLPQDLKHLAASPHEWEALALRAGDPL